MNFIEKPLLLLYFCLLACTGKAQLTAAVPFPADVQSIIASDTSAKIYITSISITGNKRTKDYIIQREMRIKQGDSIMGSKLQQLIEQSRSLVYNTTLFTEVNITPVLENNAISLVISVREKWYLYPAPQFKLVDRNFNEWIKRYNGDLDRVVYGIKFAHYNFSGRRDQLRIYLLTGYSRNIAFSYSAPYSNSALTEGFAVNASFTENREVNYRTDSLNIPVNFTNGAFVRQGIGANGVYLKRKGFYNSHIFSIGYYAVKVNDTIVKKTAGDYFNSNKSSVAYPEISYGYRHVDVDNVSYPLKGNFYNLTLFKRGLGLSGGINLLELGASGAYYKPHGKNWYSSLQVISRLKAPFELAYVNRRAMGYGDFSLRGLEYYVIDGVASALAQYTLKKKLISFDIPVPFNFKAVPKIPVALFAKSFADIGSSYISSALNTRLNNRLLYTAGFGLDILTLYDINLRLEYSFNQLGQNGLFLQMRGGF